MKNNALSDKIEQALELRVRPALRRHGGDVEVLGLDEAGGLRVRLLGQCSGCPSASLTTELLIAEELTAAVPEVKDVVLIREVGEDLMNQARALLRRNPNGLGGKV